jgi:HAE1 family hydrophobic/amphiphilic exporter-1
MLSDRPHHRPGPRPSTLGSAAGAALLLAIGGCQSPLFRPEDDRNRLQGAVDSALAREIDSLPAATPGEDGLRPPPESTFPVEKALASRKDELDRIGPQWQKADVTLDVGPTLTGEDASAVRLSLKTAIQTAVRNNLGVQAARLEEGITEARIEQAESAFDATFFASTNFQRLTQPRQGIVFPGSTGSVSVIPDVNDSRSWAFETGLRQRTVTGGGFEVAFGGGSLEQWPSDVYDPNPAMSSSVRLGLTQPLLRGFGSDVNEAQIRLARNADRAALQQLRGRLLATIADVEAAYWQVVLARQNLIISEWLVEVGVEVRDVLAKRRQYDATLAEYANAVATVEQRKANVIQARLALAQVTNTLKLLVNSPDLPVGAETIVVPVDLPVSAPVRYSLREGVVTAVANSPNVIQALLGIDNASIQTVVADNQRLPQLDLDAQLSYFGLDSSFDESVNQLGSGDFVDYIVGATFSQLIGNRYGESLYREARLARSRSVIQYRQAVQGATVDVKNRLLEVVANFELIEQTRATRLAQAENLRALEVTEKTLAALTPEFLQLKFQTQNALALAQQSAAASLVNYNVSLARLWQAMGTGLEMNRIELKTADPDGGSPAAEVTVEPEPQPAA